jgi:hypothetical protein
VSKRLKKSSKKDMRAGVFKALVNKAVFDRFLLPLFFKAYRLRGGPPVRPHGFQKNRFIFNRVRANSLL